MKEQHSLTKRVLTLLRSPKYQPLDRVELAKVLGLSGREKMEFSRLLETLELDGKIVRVRKDRYILPTVADLVTGVIQIHANGSAHLLSEQKEVADIYIASENTGTAMNRDTVVVRLVRPTLKDRARGKRIAEDRQEGKVIRIVKRATEKIVGTLQRTKKFYYVIPDDPRIPHNLYVHPEETAFPTPPQVGDKVVVRLDHWESRHVNPEGTIIEVLGPAAAPGVDMLSIVRKFGLPTDFPPAVLEEAGKVDERVPASELRTREDLRDELIYTIDPDDARDFDDAIQVERLKGGGWRLGVHIADVSHYVTPGTAMDKEAYERGNSVYLADRVIPMLPERLSNGICSLKPNVERLTRSVFVEFTETGRIKKSRFSKSVIRSVARLTYKQAYAILTGKEPEPLPVTVPDRTDVIPAVVAENIKEAWELASLLRKNRFEKGSLDLDFPEVKVWLDERGTPVRLEKIENDISHQLIEEFMLIANEVVARETKNKNFPSIYRVHDRPSVEKLVEYRALVKQYGFRVGDLTQTAEVQKLLGAIRGTPEEYPLKIAFLKSLKRAAYQVNPLGHYGLAKENYTHFTSPIRRYADLVVHRILGDVGDRKQRIAAKALPAVAEHISETERTAEEAERESVKLKKIEYFSLAATRGGSFDAVILEVRNYGLVVELPDYLVSGLVHVSELGSDFYTYDPVRGVFIGRKTRKIYRGGERLKVEVVRVDAYKQQIDFRPTEAETTGSSQLAAPRKGEARKFKPLKKEKESQDRRRAKKAASEERRVARRGKAERRGHSKRR